MFSMEEEEGGSAKRPPVGCSAPGQRASSLSDDDDDDDFLICPILDDSAKEVCDYLKGLVLTRQLSNSLPKSNFMYKVSHQTWPGHVALQRPWTLEDRSVGPSLY